MEGSMASVGAQSACILPVRVPVSPPRRPSLRLSPCPVFITCERISTADSTPRGQIRMTFVVPEIKNNRKDETEKMDKITENVQLLQPFRNHLENVDIYLLQIVKSRCFDETDF